MENVTRNIASKIQELGDLELASLLCFVAGQHCCIIEAVSGDLDNVDSELQLIFRNTFGLRTVSIHCTESTTLDDFGREILVRDGEEIAAPHSRSAGYGSDYLSAPTASSSRIQFKTPKSFEQQGKGRVADVVIARNLNDGNEQVQIQALELIRGKRIFSRREVHSAPKNLLFIALLPQGSTRLSPHLNDHMFISHTYMSGDPLPNLDAHGEGRTDDVSDAGSMSSVIHTPPATPGEISKLRANRLEPFITQEDIQTLARLSNEVAMSPDVRAYIHDIVVFLRTHRAVGGGVSALATRHLNLLSRVLPPIHSLAFITPSLVALAVNKVYPHRLVLVKPERECSLQWGSSLEAVRELLHGVTVEEVIEEVLSNIDTPL